MRNARSERGAALPTIAIMLVVILGMAAFAVDLGWLFLNANRVQKTADAASLAGVVNLPADFAQAQTDAQAAVAANGFAGADVASQRLPDNTLQVDVTTSVETFFLNVLGISTVDISRRSTAMFILPVPLANDSPCLGCAGSGFWVSINGPESAKENGDPVAARCIGDESWGVPANPPNPPNPPWECSPPNVEHRPTGYNYAIEVAEGATGLWVDVVHGGYFPTSGVDGTLNAGGTGPTLFELRAPDTTPYDLDNNPVIPGCNPGVINTQAAHRVCTIGNPAPGTYVLNVRTTGDWAGVNSFSIRAGTSSEPQPRVYGVLDMSLYMADATATPVLNLAEIEPIHAGKKLVVGLYDSGDAAAEVTMQILAPDGTTPECSWSARADEGTPGPSGSGACRITTTSYDPSVTSGFTPNYRRHYNGQWLDIEIDIPSGYTCSSDCFWKVRYSFSRPPGAPASPPMRAFDRTTWTAHIIGNPVRLVPNQS